jgi:hypothetical protein
MAGHPAKKPSTFPFKENPLKIGSHNPHNQKPKKSAPIQSNNKVRITIRIFNGKFQRLENWTPDLIELFASLSLDF